MECGSRVSVHAEVAFPCTVSCIPSRDLAIVSNRGLDWTSTPGTKKTRKCRPFRTRHEHGRPSQRDCEYLLGVQSCCPRPRHICVHCHRVQCITVPISLRVPAPSDMRASPPAATSISTGLTPYLSLPCIAGCRKTLTRSVCRGPRHRALPWQHFFQSHPLR